MATNRGRHDPASRRKKEPPPVEVFDVVEPEVMPDEPAPETDHEESQRDG